MRTKPGSPPRGRGKVDIDLFGFLCRGITPAWAGKRSWKHDHVRKHGDHPRVGGEKVAKTISGGTNRGSPPRGRGKGGVCGHKPRHHRITPAWAGKRSMTDMVRVWARDHPRVGGEKVAHTEEVSRLRGSPPRGRGKARLRVVLVPTRRITPAWAGKSSCS